MVAAFSSAAILRPRTPGAAAGGRKPRAPVIDRRAGGRRRPRRYRPRASATTGRAQDARFRRAVARTLRRKRGVKCSCAREKRRRKLLPRSWCMVLRGCRRFFNSFSVCDHFFAALTGNLCVARSILTRLTGLCLRIGHHQAESHVPISKKKKKKLCWNSFLESCHAVAVIIESSSQRQPATFSSCFFVLWYVSPLVTARALVYFIYCFCPSVILPP